VGKKGRYAARFLPHRHNSQLPHAILPTYLWDGGERGGDVGHDEYPPHNTHDILRSSFDGEQGLGGGVGGGWVGGEARYSGAVDTDGAGVVLRHDSILRGSLDEGQMSPLRVSNRGDQWGGGGAGRASVDRSQYVRGSGVRGSGVRGSGGQIVPGYMMRENPRMEHEDVSGQGMWGAADLRQRERVLHDQEHDRQKQAKRRMLEQRQRAQWQAEDEQEERERTRASGRAHDVGGELGGRGTHVSFGGHEEMGGEEERRREQNGHELSGHELSGKDSWSHAHQQLREVGVGVGSDPFGRRENADVSDGQVGGGGQHTHGLLLHGRGGG